MPANLPPEYFKAEQRYLQAKTLEEKIQATQELIRIAPKHKGTEKLLRVLKHRLAKLRKELEEREKRRGGGGGPSFAVKKEGCAQVALVGLPNSGKSTLLRKLTNARPEVAEYPFTTRLPVPGMMDYEDVQVQLVEIPSIVEGSSLGKGLGAQPLSAARNADVIARVVDASSDPLHQVETLVRELEESGVRLNRSPPKVTIQRREEGGIVIRGKELVEGGEEGIKELLREHRIHNALVVAEERVSLQTLEEILEGSVVYRPCFVLLTKTDLSPTSGSFSGLRVIDTGRPLQELKREIFESLGLIRVYTKRPNEEPSERPLVLPRGSTPLDVARAIHKELEKGMRSARVWGSTRFPGQWVPRDYPLQDGDVVELHSD
ncbi:MAG: GTPase [Candidatus Hadarchaeales archaeon]